MNGDLLISSRKLQSPKALSSAESELYASCSGFAELLRVGSLLKFLIGEDVQMTAYSDSSAARGIMQRAGQGKLKRIHIRNLWIQDLVREKIIRLCRVPTAINPSDLNTKKLSQERRKKLMTLIPIGFQTGMEIQNIETEKTLDSRSLQEILRVLLAGSCFLQGCEHTFLTGVDALLMDYLTIKNMVMAALTLLIAYLIYAIRLQQVQLRFSQNVFDELTQRLRPDRHLRRPGDPNSSSSPTSTSQESGPFTSGITPDRPRRQRQRMTPGDAMRLGWRPPLHIGALAELGEEYVALQGVWQDIDPSRFQRGLMNAFPVPFRRAGSSGRNRYDEAQEEHDQDLPDQHEQVPEEKKNLLERNQVQNKL